MQVKGIAVDLKMFALCLILISVVIVSFGNFKFH